MRDALGSRSRAQSRQMSNVFPRPWDPPFDPGVLNMRFRRFFISAYAFAMSTVVFSGLCLDV